MKKWLLASTLLFLLFIIAIVIFANAGQFPESLKSLYNFPGGDKVGHFFLFGILSFLLNRSALTLFPNRNPTRLVLTVSLLLSILIGLEEWSQSLFPSRTMSITDLISSYLGVVLFAVLAYWTLRLPSPKASRLLEKKWLFFLTALITLFVLALIIAADTGQLPSVLEMAYLNIGYRVPRWGRFVHLFLFGILSFFLNKSALVLFPNRNPIRIILTVSLLLSILIGLEEWSQSLFPTRNLSIKDLISSCLGVFLFALLAYRTLDMKGPEISRLLEKKWLLFATVFMVLLIPALVIATDTGHLAIALDVASSIPGGDKFVHLFLFGILSFLLNKSVLLLFPKQNPVRLILIISIFLLILIGLEEWSQSLFPARTVSVIDLLAGYLGVILFAYFAYHTR